MEFGEWWTELAMMSKVFWSISIVFSILFFIQFVMSLFGFDFMGDSDADGGDADGFDHDFTLVSIRGIIAFFTFFGWTGVILQSGGSGVIATFFFSALAGVAAMFLVAYLFYLFGKLTESGTVDTYQALFTTGEVYLPIPERRKGSGKVLIRLGGSYREMEAVTEGNAIATGSKVKVVEILENSLLVVIPLDSYES